MGKRSGVGRKKITMVKIESESHREVTFSKRRDGIFKKINELGICCVAEFATIAFSETNKAYSFGHPSVAEVVNDYLISSNVDNEPVVLLGDSRPIVPVPEYDLAQMKENISREKAKGKQLEEEKKATENHSWWDGIDDADFQLTPEQVDFLESKLAKVYKDMETEHNKIGFEANNNVGEAAIDTTMLNGQFHGMGYGHTQDPGQFVQTAPAPFDQTPPPAFGQIAHAPFVQTARAAFNQILPGPFDQTPPPAFGQIAPASAPFVQTAHAAFDQILPGPFNQTSPPPAFGQIAPAPAPFVQTAPVAVYQIPPGPFDQTTPAAFGQIAPAAVDQIPPHVFGQIEPAYASAPFVQTAPAAVDQIPPVNQITPAAFMDFDVSDVSGLGSELHYDVSSFFTNNNPSLDETLGIGTSGTIPTIPFYPMFYDGAGPSGTNTYHGSNHGNRSGNY